MACGFKDLRMERWPHTQGKEKAAARDCSGCSDQKSHSGPRASWEATEAFGMEEGSAMEGARNLSDKL